ncbi:hypothetical protein DB32_003321 [Sandaracinus amylolyticus]|uniref:Uncharacterized protein n=2 Tax=Sandaracinus amylolyticus TaxID=927083 RepID=A0A0F6YHT6_9BACT|nr:hypothetical protein DB32_003321 [Sandaracinus amylolyticus]
MNDVGGKRISISMTASIGAHLVLAIGLAFAPEILPTTEHVRPDTEFTLEITTPTDEVVAEPEPEVAPEPEREPEPEVVPEREPEVERPTPPAARRSEPAPAALVVTPAPSVSITPDTQQEPELTPHVDETPRETEAQRVERMRTLLDPSAVARRSFVVEGPGPSVPQRERAGAIGGTGTDLVPRGEAEVERELSEGLRTQAMAKAYLARTRPEVRRRPDGTHVYSGHAFTATIRPDGSVQFEDRPGIQTDGFSTSGSFDITDAFMRASGQDPYAAEREWFMEHTEELRNRLEDETRAQAMAAGMRRLRGQLTRIWQDEARPAEQRRRAIFEQWAEVDDSGGGGDARSVIEEFVREHLPLGSPDAFTSDELRRLNGRLESGTRFAPYR